MVASKQQNKEPDDHIALELEFMAWLCNQSETAAQQQFLNNHILKWVPLFCSDVAKGADTSFYRIVAELTGAWVEATTKAQYQK
jgi:TorA maturation chaperone TorD